MPDFVQGRQERKKKGLLPGLWIPGDHYGNNRSTITPAEFAMCIGSNGLTADYSKCCICEWGLGSIDLAHIKPHRNGGEYAKDNIVPLCPNHHRLFDRNLLDEEQQAQIEKFIEQILPKWSSAKQI